MKMYLGALVVIAWAVLTAIAYARRERPVPAQYREDDVQPWDVPTTFASGSRTIVTWERP